jgi:hypothetical protein
MDLCDSGRRFPAWGKQFLIRTVLTAAYQCRATATGWAGLNAPGATGSIPLNPTGRRAGFRASCDRRSKVAALTARERKRPQRDSALRPIKSGESIKYGLMQAGPEWFPR